MTLIGFLSVSCSKEECELTDHSYEYVEQGALYGDGDEGISASNLVIKTQTEWDDLVAKMDAVNDESSGFENVPSNFDEQMIIACFDQVRPSGGYGIDITSTDVVDGELQITVVKTEPSGASTTVITQPYVIIVMDKCEGTVTFID